MSSSSLVAVRCPWGPSALRSRDIGRQASFLALRYPSRDPESRHCELIAALWRFPADVGETRGCDVFATSERGFAGKVQASIVPSATTTASPAIAADVSSPCLIEIESSIRLGRRCRRGGFGRTKKPQVGGRVRTKNEPDASGAGRN